ncbi:hypothetical protein HMPREF9098_1271 [Kingella denitrificans ATCC 33394]|uniref:Uncharacterized protein n=1 Tax=Kingella denitrificans ATCC 33394 TaxID=888741 RepID=F0EZT6_9NEIS|nr:hypothetical protein HMPREF9098_1271 [Kingella denitrificans ATCC 33394]
MFDLIFRRFFSNKRVQAAFLQFINLRRCNAVVPLSKYGIGKVQTAFEGRAKAACT